jgi:uncharacterized protein (DUF4415 family)
MRKKERIVRYSAEQVAAKLARGEDRTDWKRVAATPQAKVELLADEEDGPLPADWTSAAIIGLPPPKKDIHIRLDADILDWFKKTGRGYQTRINNVLRAYVTTRKRPAR